MITSIEDQRTKVQILLRDNITFNAVLMAAITLVVTEPDSLAALCKAFPDIARETFLRLMSNGGFVSLDEWLEDTMTPGTLPEPKQLEHLKSLFATSDLAADQCFRQATNWPLGDDQAAGLTPEQIAGITMKIRARGLITEDRKPEVIDALVEYSQEATAGTVYEPHHYNMPVDDLVAARLADKAGPTHQEPEDDQADQLVEICPSCAGGSVTWTITCPVCQNAGKVSKETYDWHRNRQLPAQKD